MSRIWKILMLLTLTIAGGWLLWWQPPPEAAMLQSTEPPAIAIKTTAQNTQEGEASVKLNSVTDEAQQAAQQRAAERFKQQAQQFRALFTKRPGNLQQWLDQLWQQCRDLAQQSCQAELAGLSQQLSAAELDQLLALLADYHQYQLALSELQLSTNLSVKERVSAIQQLRHSTFGQLTDILFGLEHQFADYQIAVAELSNTTQQLTVSERLTQLSQLQQQLAGSDPALFGPDQAYQQALALLQDLPRHEQQQWQERLRQQYFGEEAKAVAVFEQQQQQLAEQRAGYQDELTVLEQDFARRKPELTSEQWQQQYAKALAELRLRHFPAH